MNLLLSVFESFWKMFVFRISQLPVIIALGLTILGVVFSVLGARVARAVRKRNNIDDNDSIVISFKVISLVLLFIAIVILIADSGVFNG